MFVQVEDLFNDKNANERNNIIFQLSKLTSNKQIIKHNSSRAHVYVLQAQDFNTTKFSH